MEPGILPRAKRRARLRSAQFVSESDALGRGPACFQIAFHLRPSRGPLGSDLHPKALERMFRTLVRPLRGSPISSPPPIISAAPKSAEPSDTKLRLLDAAERLFAQHGFENATLRAVTQLAGVSVSAANYHFGSKEALLLSAISRRLGPLNEKRLESLERSLQATAPRPLSPRAVLEAFLRPTFDHLHDLGPDRPNAVSYRLLAARLYTDPHPRVAALKAELFGSLADRYVAALVPSFPELQREDLLLRFHFVVGVLVHMISGHCQQGLVQADGSAFFCDADLFERMLAFATAGLELDSVEPPTTDDDRRRVRPSHEEIDKSNPASNPATAAEPSGV
jgi:AcrR family transcriptional regulator